MLKSDAATAIPGQPPAPIIGWRGNMLRFFRDPLTYLTASQRAYGDVAAFARGGNGNLLATVENCPGTVFAFGEANNQAILTRTDIFQMSPMPTTQLGHAPTTRLLSGIFSMNGSKHRQQRRLMMPAFHKKRIEGYLNDMIAMTEGMLSQWQFGSQPDLNAAMTELTLQIACKTLFGLDILHGDQNIGAMIANWTKANLNPLIMTKLDLPGTPYRRFTRLSVELDGAMRAVLDRKRNSGVDEGDVLSMLIHSRDENGEQMTEDELVGQANILFFAGHETTANALTWTIFLLMQHTDIYGKVLEELATKLGGAVPTPDQLNELPYLDRVIKESMRILPPVPFLLRVAMEDTELGGYKIKRGSEVIYSPYITHHSPDLYPDPQRFDPDRWLTVDPSPYAYIPFGAGLRMCIGAPFALMEAKLVLSILLQRYQFKLLDTKIDREVTLTMSPKGGLHVLLESPDKRPIAAPTPIQGNVRELVDLPQ